MTASRKHDFQRVILRLSKMEARAAACVRKQNQPSLVPAEDKAAYAAIFDEVLHAADQARAASPGEPFLELKPMNYSAEYGSRGHRPVDLWVSLCGKGSEPLGQMPQVYAIASERGLEVGFAVSIDEADYHNPVVKARNRTVVPLLNAKLPASNNSMTATLDVRLKEQGGWHFNTKTRLTAEDEGFNAYSSLSDMIDALKNSRDVTGGGTVCRLFSPSQLDHVDLEGEFKGALENFLPLMSQCAPSPWDLRVVADQDAVSELAEEVSFDPSSQADARRKVLAEVARRQGQAEFRKALLKAYGGRCAITGTAVPSVLQAAHITPYLGPQTNHVTNGLLLRADLHTLLDLHLIRIEPATLKVQVSDGLKGTPYVEFHGRTLATTSKLSERPSHEALLKHFGETAATVRTGSS